MAAVEESLDCCVEFTEVFLDVSLLILVSSGNDVVDTDPTSDRSVRLSDISTAVVKETFRDSEAVKGEKSDKVVNDRD